MKQRVEGENDEASQALGHVSVSSRPGWSTETAMDTQRNCVLEKKEVHIFNPSIQEGR